MRKEARGVNWLFCKEEETHRMNQLSPVGLPLIQTHVVRGCKSILFGSKRGISNNESNVFRRTRP